MNESFQNQFRKSSFLPEYEPNILRISALYYVFIICVFNIYIMKLETENQSHESLNAHASIKIEFHFHMS